MYSTSPIFRGIVLMAVLVLVSASAFADTIRLKDGSIIKGKIVRFSGGTFSVEIGEGPRMRKMTFSVNEIESIQFDSPQVPINTARVDQPVVKQPPIVKVSDNMPPSGNASIPPRVVTTDPTPVKTNDDGRNTSSEPKVITSDPTAAVKTPPVITAKSAPPQNTNSSVSQPKVSAPVTGDPIELNVKVLADNTSNGWTNSGWVVKKGQRIRITGDGEVNLGNGKTSPPAGLSDLPDDQKLLKAVPTGALIAVIGDDNNDFIYVGSSREFTATRDGTLFLGVNEGNLNDNSGSFAVKIQILPSGK